MGMTIAVPCAANDGNGRSTDAGLPRNGPRFEQVAPCGTSMRMEDSLLAFDGHLRAGRLDQAKTLLAHVTERAKRDVDVRIAVCRFDAATGQLARGIEGLEVIVTEEPRHAEAMAYLAGLVARAGDHGRALMLARRANERGARVPEAMVLLADDAMRAEQFEEALALWSTALSIDDGIADAWFGKGRAHLALGERMLAEEAYVQGVTREPANVDAWVTLVELEIEASAVDIARENLALALRAHPGERRLVEILGASRSNSIPSRTASSAFVKQSMKATSTARATSSMCSSTNTAATRASRFQTPRLCSPPKNAHASLNSCMTSCG
jgi:tetratricopeptide (TPR) repeat protein